MLKEELGNRVLDLIGSRHQPTLDSVLKLLKAQIAYVHVENEWFQKKLTEGTNSTGTGQEKQTELYEFFKMKEAITHTEHHQKPSPSSQQASSGTKPAGEQESSTMNKACKTLGYFIACFSEKFRYIFYFFHSLDQIILNQLNE